jgi:hypothetical protein
MSTSGTTAFNLDLNNIIEEAFERCGAELRTGYDMRTARRSLNLLTIEWANRGINLWTVEQGQINLVTGQAIYPIPVNTIDLLDHQIRQNNGDPSTQIDISITRISEPTYASIPNKLTTGRPIQVWINRQSGQSNLSAAVLGATIDATTTSITVSDSSYLTNTGFIKIDNETISYTNVIGNVLTNCARGQNGTTAASHTIGAAITVQNLPCVNVWPTPDAGGGPYTLIYWRLRRVQDVGSNGAVEQDIPFRLLPCLVSGLAFYMGQKLPDGQPRLQFLKQEYEEQWLMASTEDREKAPVRFVPRNTFYGN